MKNPTKAAPAVEVQPAYLRPEGAAKYCCISRRYLATLTARGVFPCTRMGRKLTLYARADLDAAIARLRTGAIGEG